MGSNQYVVHPEDVESYSPLNHEDTVNRRLIGNQNVGAQQLEVVLGVIKKGGGSWDSKANGF